MQQMIHRPSSTYSMTQRLRQKSKACENFQNLTNRQLIVNKQIIYNIKTYNISYCGVGKAGGTFFKQFFSVLTKGEHKSKELQTLARVHVHQSMRKYKVLFDDPDWKHARLLTVGRNPYSRLYSAYIDRVTLPQITAPIRAGALCKFDVTFEDFLKYVVRHTEYGIMNQHWSPIFYICKPCLLTSTYIVKQETFTKDIQYILTALKLPRNKTDAIEQILIESRTNWTITGIVKNVIEVGRKEYSNPGCIGHYGLMKQLWRSFQIQGYIDERIQLTEQMFTEIGNLTSNVNKVIQTVLTIIERYPLSSEKRKLQRRRYLANAYKEVEYVVIQDIQRVFKPDFDMFGYSYEPPTE